MYSMMLWPKPYLNLIFCFRMCSIHASMNAVIVILNAWTRASSDSVATLSKTWPITAWAARDAYSLGLTGKPVHQQRNIAPCICCMRCHRRQISVPVLWLSLQCTAEGMVCAKISPDILLQSLEKVFSTREEKVWWRVTQSIGIRLHAALFAWHGCQTCRIKIKQLTCSSHTALSSASSCCLSCSWLWLWKAEWWSQSEFIIRDLVWCTVTSKDSLRACRDRGRTHQKHACSELKMVRNTTQMLAIDV